MALPVETCRSVALQTAEERVRNSIRFAENNPQFPQYQKWLTCKNKPLVLEAENTHDYIGRAYFYYRYSITCDAHREVYDLTYEIWNGGCTWHGE